MYEKPSLVMVGGVESIVLGPILWFDDSEVWEPLCPIPSFPAGLDA